jgi:hypothetical protein
MLIYLKIFKEDKMYRGAGGNNGGEGSFFLGLVMMIAGGYLFLRSVHVDHYLSMGAGLFHMGSFQITNGMVLIPFMFGVGMIFYNSKNYLGWFLFGASIIALVFGIIASINFSLQGMSAFDLITMIVLFVGGLGLFLKGLKSQEARF